MKKSSRSSNRAIAPAISTAIRHKCLLASVATATLLTPFAALAFTPPSQRAPFCPTSSLSAVSRRDLLVVGLLGRIIAPPGLARAETVRSSAVPPGYSLNRGGASSAIPGRAAVEGLVYLPEKNAGLDRFLSAGESSEATVVLTVSSLPVKEVQRSLTPPPPTAEEKEAAIRMISEAIASGTAAAPIGPIPGEGPVLAGARISVGSLPRKGIFPYQFQLFDVNVVRGKEVEWTRAASEEDMVMRAYVCLPPREDGGRKEACPGGQGMVALQGRGLAKLVKVSGESEGVGNMVIRAGASVMLQ